jgi:hypothetical protein
MAAVLVLLLLLLRLLLDVQLACWSSFRLKGSEGKGEGEDPAGEEQCRWFWREIRKDRGDIMATAGIRY